MRYKVRLIFASISILLLLTSTAAQQREIQPVEFKQISENLYEIHGGRGANGGFYIGDNSVLVIDAKMDKESVAQVLKGIKNLTDKPIKYLVNTHSDGDHITGNRYFPESVIFVSHENCRKEFFHPRRDGSPSGWDTPELAPFVPSITYRRKMDMPRTSEQILQMVRNKLASKNQTINQLQKKVADLETKLSQAYTEIENYEKLLDSINDLIQEDV